MKSLYHIRRAEIETWAAEGLSCREIAERLGVSPRTVATWGRRYGFRTRLGNGRSVKNGADLAVLRRIAPGTAVLLAHEAEIRSHLAEHKLTHAEIGARYGVKTNVVSSWRRKLGIRWRAASRRNATHDWLDTQIDRILALYRDNHSYRTAAKVLGVPKHALQRWGELRGVRSQYRRPRQAPKERRVTGTRRRGELPVPSPAKIRAHKEYLKKAHWWAG